MQHGSAAKKAVKKRHAFIMRRSVNTVAHSRSLNSWPDFPWIEQKEMYRQNDPVPDDALTNGSPNSKVEERGDLLFWLHTFRIMHVMWNIGEWKRPLFSDSAFSAVCGPFADRDAVLSAFCSFSSFDAFHLRFAVVIFFRIIFYNRFYRTHIHSLSAYSILFQARIFYIHYGIRVRTILIVLFFCAWPFVRAILIRWLDSGLWFHDNL